MENEEAIKYVAKYYGIDPSEVLYDVGEDLYYHKNGPNRKTKLNVPSSLVSNNTTEPIIKTQDEIVEEVKAKVIEVSPNTSVEDITITPIPSIGGLEFEVSVGDTIVSIGDDKTILEDLEVVVKPILAETGLPVEAFKSLPTTNNSGTYVLEDPKAVTQEQLSTVTNTNTGITSNSAPQAPIKTVVDKRKQQNELEELTKVTNVNPKTGDITYKKVKNKLGLAIARRQGYITDDERTEATNSVVNANELSGRKLNGDRYQVKVGDEGSANEYMLVDTRTGVTRPINNNVILSVNQKNNKLTATDSANLHKGYDIANEIPLSKETIGDYINDDKVISTKPIPSGNTASPSSTQEAMESTSTLGEKLSKITEDMTTGDKVGLAARTLPALINIGRGMLDKAEKHEPVKNPYAKSALNTMRRRRMAINNTAGRLKDQVARNTIQNNSSSNASRNANLANLAANAKRQEDIIATQEANTNQIKLPQENANFALSVGAGEQAAITQAESLNRQSKAARDNLTTTGLKQLSQVGSDIANIKNANLQDKRMLELLATDQYEYVDGKLVYKPRAPSSSKTKPTTKSTQASNYTTNRPSYTKFNPPSIFNKGILDDPLKVNTEQDPTLERPLLGQEILKPSWHKPLGFERGGNLDVDLQNERMRLKELRKKLKQLKRK